jgi:phytoene dehydrogenase-like protein
MSADWDWTAKTASYRDRILARLADLGFDVRKQIRAEQILHPLEIQQRTGAWRGSLYGHSFNDWLASFRRPHNRCPDLEGLYFCGGATHPGGGVPLATLSGKVAAQMLLSDRSGGTV